MLRVDFPEYAPKLSKLSKKYGEVLQFIQELPRGRLEDVEGAVPDALQTLSIWQEKLVVNHTTILVSGETEDDVVKLTKELCGADVFDPDLLATNTRFLICQSSKPLLILHTDESNIHERVNLHHTQDVLFPKDDIRRHLKAAPDTIEIHWNLAALQNGISLLVVPPSACNRKEMFKGFQACLPPPSGILYHLTCLPRNLHLQRIRTMIAALESVSWARSLEDKRTLTFDTNSLLFVSDQHITIGRLAGALPKVWKGVTGENLVTLDSIDSQMNQIDKFCRSCLQESTENAYRFLSTVLQRAFLTLKGNLSTLNDTSYNNRDLYESIMNSLVKVETKPEEISKEIDMLKEKEISLTIDKVSQFLTNPVTREKIMHWTDADCPEIQGDMDHVNATFLAKVLFKIREAINQWDSRLHVFENMQRRILDVFKTRFANIEGQLANIESKLLNGDMVYSDGSTDSDESDYVNMGFSFKFQVALAISSNVPFGDVLDHSSLMYLEEKLPQRRNVKEYIDYYQKHKVHEMRDITDIVLNGLLKDVGIKAILKDKLDNFVELLNGLVKNVPSLIQADKDMVENIMLGCEESDEKVHCIYWDKYSEAKTLTGELAFLYLSEIRRYDIDTTDITGWGDVIAEGTYGKVQLATLQRGTESTNVAVKMMKDELTEHNASGFIAEEESLRRLQRPHIVKYYGTALQEAHGAVYPLMLMEYCPTTLDMHIIGRDVQCPGRYPTGSQERKDVEHGVARWAYQICSGLMSIHQMGYMHRDLKPKNILIDGAGDVKLADLGLAKLERDVKNTYCGTPSYMAPEILRGSQYTKAADMYSFSMILCEMWMGNYVDYLYKVPLNEIERGIKDRGLRPRLYPNGPYGTWKDVIETCWTENPRERYSANYCCKVFSKLMKE